MMKNASRVVTVAARGSPVRRARLAWIGLSTIANTAAQPSGARNGPTTRNVR